MKKVDGDGPEETAADGAPTRIDPPRARPAAAEDPVDPVRPAGSPSVSVWALPLVGLLGGLTGAGVMLWIAYEPLESVADPVEAPTGTVSDPGPSWTGAPTSPWESDPRSTLPSDVPSDSVAAPVAPPRRAPLLPRPAVPAASRPPARPDRPTSGAAGTRTAALAPDDSHLPPPGPALVVTVTPTDPGVDRILPGALSWIRDRALGCYRQTGTLSPVSVALYTPDRHRASVAGDETHPLARCLTRSLQGLAVTRSGTSGRVLITAARSE